MSTQEQNTPRQKDARPIWARLRAKATAEAVQPQHYTRPQHYSRADILKQSNIWFRKQGAPLIISARQRALDAFPRSVPCRESCGLASCTSAISSCATFSSS